MNPNSNLNLNNDTNNNTLLLELLAEASTILPLATTTITTRELALKN